MTVPRYARCSSSGVGPALLAVAGEDVEQPNMSGAIVSRATGSLTAAIVIKKASGAKRGVDPGAAGAHRRERRAAGAGRAAQLRTSVQPRSPKS